MLEYVEKSPKELSQNMFDLIGNQWMLITAGNKDKVNTMTASWGGVGVMWGKDVVYVVMRPQRYTKTFVDQNDCFSLTFFDKEYKKKLSYLGTTSGKNENKIEKSELTLAFEQDIPYFTESNLVLCCKKLYKQELSADNLIDGTIDERWYPEKDYHTLYIAEIVKVLER